MRTLDDLYSSLVAVWPGTGMVTGVTVASNCALDDPLPAVLADDPVARMMIQDLRSYLPDNIMIGRRLAARPAAPLGRGSAVPGQSGP